MEVRVRFLISIIEAILGTVYRYFKIKTILKSDKSD